MKKKIILTGIVIILIAIQFKQIDKSVPENLNHMNDFLMVENPAPLVKANLQVACYDCHSYQTRYPRYAGIAPVSWIIAHHIEEGREHVNFSQWANYPAEKRAHIIEECIEEISKGKMPLASYTFMHNGARLKPHAKDSVLTWLRSLK